MKYTKTATRIVIINCILLLMACTGQNQSEHIPGEVKIVGAMKNVMWNGELGGVIDLDTIADKQGLYGLGPLANLQGELMINDGKSYVSKVNGDSIMVVEETYAVQAPFFVYANQESWNKVDLPPTILTITDLERFIEQKSGLLHTPFVFKLKGDIAQAKIHIQNLPRGTKVSSPQEAHQGQLNYILKNQGVEIVGFFSKDHKGIFTHHDSFMHMHLITDDKSQMGHVDDLAFHKNKTPMVLFLP